LSRSIRTTALAGAAAGLIALMPASAAAVTSVNPISLDFGSQPVGTTSAGKSTTLVVDCDLVLVPPLCMLPGTFSPTIATTGDFSQTNTCPPVMTAIVQPGTSCPITVTFKPSAIGPRTGTLSTGSGGPTVPLSGTGIAPASTPPVTAPTKRKKCKKAKRRLAQAAKKKRKCKKKKKRR
jgi:hypothetical protein